MNMLQSRPIRLAVSLCLTGALLLGQTVPAHAVRGECNQTESAEHKCSGCGHCKVAEAGDHCGCCCGGHAHQAPARESTPPAHRCCGVKKPQAYQADSGQLTEPIAPVVARACLCGRTPPPTAPPQESRNGTEQLVKLSAASEPPSRLHSAEPPQLPLRSRYAAPPLPPHHAVQRLLCIWLI